MDIMKTVTLDKLPEKLEARDPKLLFVLLVLAGCSLALLLQQILPTKVGTFELYSSYEQNGEPSSDPCASTSECLMVYLQTPCSECQDVIPLIQGLQEFVFNYSGSVGVMLVVGGQDDDSISQMAEEFSGEVFLDYDNQLDEQVSIVRSPAWILWDKDRTVQYFQYGDPRISGSPEEQAQAFLSDYVFKRKAIKR